MSRTNRIGSSLRVKFKRRYERTKRATLRHVLNVLNTMTRHALSARWTLELLTETSVKVLLRFTIAICFQRLMDRIPLIQLRILFHSAQTAIVQRTYYLSMSMNLPQFTTLGTKCPKQLNSSGGWGGFQNKKWFLATAGLTVRLSDFDGRKRSSSECS